MKLNKPYFWDKKNSYISFLLMPFTFLFTLIIFLKKKISITNKFKILIICVGNIYIGGTGKTPTSILLAKEFSRLGKKTAILRKYYKTHSDEYNLIRNSFKNLILSKNRDDGLRKAEESNFDLVILDDGLQDYKIKKNLNIVCFNQDQLIGNGLLLPSGPLRENLSSLKNAQIILINGKEDKIFENKVLRINKKLEIFYSCYKPLNLDRFKHKKLLAVAGIGNPNNFFELLLQNNLKIEKKLIFPDHHKFSKIEIENIIKEAKTNNLQIIMTEKDYYKINDYKFEDVDYLKVSLEIDNKVKFLEKISSLYDKNN